MNPFVVKNLLGFGRARAVGATAPTLIVEIGRQPFLRLGDGLGFAGGVILDLVLGQFTYSKIF